MEEFNNDFLFKNKPDETTPKSAENLNIALKNTRAICADNAGAHNAIFRGKNITNYFDDGSLWERISSGKFTDLFVGDYILKNDITYRIAGFDIYLNRGKTKLTKHHAVIIPDAPFLLTSMNESNTTEGGYIQSTMYKSTLNQLLSTRITPVFSTHVLQFSSLLTNGIGSNGLANSSTWVDVKLNLMNEIQFYGYMARAVNGYEIGADTTQFPLFKLAPEFMSSNNNWIFLRCIFNASMYVSVGNTSEPYYTNANGTSGIRPYFYID